MWYAGHKEMRGQIRLADPVPAGDSGLEASLCCVHTRGAPTILNRYCNTKPCTGFVTVAAVREILGGPG